jgi:hypothetical protein
VSLHSNYQITIEHPLTEELADAHINFYYTAGSDGSFDEPPSNAEIEIISIVIDGEDVYDLFPILKLQQLEGMIMGGVFNDDFDKPEYEYPDGYEV